jgi:solute carrier family 25 phosphate transporter 23/24/25/41
MTETSKEKSDTTKQKVVENNSNSSSKEIPITNNVSSSSIDKLPSKKISASTEVETRNNVKMSSQIKATNEEIFEIFKSFDKDNDNIISIDELEKVLHSFDIPISQFEVGRLFSQMDSDHDSIIKIDEFIKFYRKRENDLLSVYNKLCSPNNTLSANSLRIAINELGMKASDEEIRKFILQCDKNHDGLVTFQEFVPYLLLLPSNNALAEFDNLKRQIGYIDFGHPEYTAPIEEKHLFGSSTISFISGGLAGIVSRTGTSPIDRLKVLMQSGKSDMPTSINEGLKKIYGQGGLKAFFRGNGVNCCKAAPETGIKMMFFEIFKELVSKDVGAINIQERFIAGGLAGALTQTIVYPMETIKTRFAVSTPGLYSSIYSCINKIIKQEGYISFYRGLTISILGVVPYAGIDLMLNSLIKENFSKYYDQNKEQPGVTSYLIAGMISSTVAMSLTYPISLIKTRLQVSGMKLCHYFF